MRKTRRFISQKKQAFRVSFSRTFRRFPRKSKNWLSTILDRGSVEHLRKAGKISEQRRVKIMKMWQALEVLWNSDKYFLTIILEHLLYRTHLNTVLPDEYFSFDVSEVYSEPSPPSKMDLFLPKTINSLKL